MAMGGSSGFREGTSTSFPHSLVWKKKGEKCFECHTRPCVLGGDELLAPTWMHGSTYGWESGEALSVSIHSGSGMQNSQTFRPGSEVRVSTLIHMC
jgi:hypothetical protein